MTESAAREIYRLEELFSRDVVCQMKHTTTCTVHAKHRAKDCVKSFFVCENGRKAIEFMQQEGDLCVNCERPAAICWTVSVA